ncbi:MAG: glutathione S-transferase C-terminal domain-containing protein [Paracoccaceae bacterium]|nr:glutathione S-transferase C-terminal domain-containing protein [Paracoccaceae bacterium]
MGMLVDGVWYDDADQTMEDGRYRRKASLLPQRLLPGVDAISDDLVFVASLSCPWSHAATIVHTLNELADRIPPQLATGPRTQGYRLAPNGPLTAEGEFLHRLYSRTDATYTGRATVPLLWDRGKGRIASNDSKTILRFFDTLGMHTNLRPAGQEAVIDELLTRIHDGLANAVYRAGKAQRQDEYEEAVEAVYETLQWLEDRLRFQQYLLTDHLTEPDVRLFATLVRFDTVYATHFRCTRFRLTDFPNLWRFTRDIYRMPKVQQTVDFDEIRRGYYLNDGDHNPHGIIAEQPVLDW